MEESRRLVCRHKKDMGIECGSRYDRIRDRQEEMETECYEEKVQSQWKTDYKPIIIYILLFTVLYNLHNLFRPIS